VRSKRHDAREGEARRQDTRVNTTFLVLLTDVERWMQTREDRSRCRQIKVDGGKRAHHDAFVAGITVDDAECVLELEAKVGFHHNAVQASPIRGSAAGKLL
jgi:hypothetical protein